MEYENSIFLREDELMAILSMGGMETLYCFQQEQTEPLDQQQLLQINCRLLSDGLMTQVDGQYRLRKDVFEVVYPIYQAKEALVITPADTRKAPVICYLGDRVSVLRRTPFGGFYLQPLEREALPDAIADHLELAFYEPSAAAPEQRETTGVFVGASAEALLQDAYFLVEEIDLQQQMRQRWLREVRWEFIPWLEYSSGDGILTEPMTRELFDTYMNMLIKGA